MIRKSKEISLPANLQQRAGYGQKTAMLILWFEEK